MHDKNTPPLILPSTLRSERSAATSLCADQKLKPDSWQFPLSKQAPFSHPEDTSGKEVASQGVARVRALSPHPWPGSAVPARARSAAAGRCSGEGTILEVRLRQWRAGAGKLMRK